MFQSTAYRQKACFGKLTFKWRVLFVEHLLTSEMTTEIYHQDFFDFSSINEHHHELKISEKRWVKVCDQLKESNVYLIYQKNLSL